MPLVAVKTREYRPAEPDDGVPLSVAVPLPLFTNVTPLGRVPDTLRAGDGTPVVVTVKEPGVPATKMALFALVNAGAKPTVSVKL